MVEPGTELSDPERRLRTRLVVLAYALFSVFIAGLAYMATTPSLAVGLTLSYTAGLSMIVLPCTLPLVFVIVPMSMGQEYRKGFIMALLFGGGLMGVSVAIQILYSLYEMWLRKKTTLSERCRVTFISMITIQGELRDEQRSTGRAN